MSETEQNRQAVRKLVEQLASFEPSHPTFDEMAGYVDGTLDPISREIVSTHAEDCLRCRRELRDLGAFARPRRRWVGWGAAAAVAAGLIAALLIFRAPIPPRDIHIPQYALDLRSTALALRSTRHPTPDARYPDPLSPLGAVIITDRPTFTWSAVPNARYRVEVFDLSFRPVVASDLLPIARWTPPHPLPRGGTYAWQVTAITEAGSITAPRPPSPEARFMVLDTAHAEAIERLERSESRPSLALGVAYVEAGALDEAQRELRAIDSDESRRILRLLR